MGYEQLPKNASLLLVLSSCSYRRLRKDSASLQSHQVLSSGPLRTSQRGHLHAHKLIIVLIVWHQFDIQEDVMLIRPLPFPVCTSNCFSAGFIANFCQTVVESCSFSCCVLASQQMQPMQTHRNDFPVKSQNPANPADIKCQRCSDIKLALNGFHKDCINCTRRKLWAFTTSWISFE